MITDPVCKAEIDPEESEDQTEYFGEVYYFCSPICKCKFDMDPLDYIPEPWRDLAYEVAE